MVIQILHTPNSNYYAMPVHAQVSKQITLKNQFRCAELIKLSRNIFQNRTAANLQCELYVCVLV